MPLEIVDLNYEKYIEQKTGYKINLFSSFYSRINKIMGRGKISTDQQYREAGVALNFLSEFEENSEQADILDKLMFEYNETKRKKLPN